MEPQVAQIHPGTFPGQQQQSIPPQYPGVVPQQQQQAPQSMAYPGQQYGAAVQAAPVPAAANRQYKTATPIAALGRSPAPVDCPSCGQRALTSTIFLVGNTTHGWAAALCCLICLGCIPYIISSTKDVEHKCGQCGVALATWHRSGSTDVHLHH